MTSCNYMSVINVRTERSTDGWFALSSSDLPEFFMGGQNLEKLLADAPAVIAALFRLNYDMEMDVIEAGSPASADSVYTPVQPQFVTRQIENRQRA